MKTSEKSKFVKQFATLGADDRDSAAPVSLDDVFTIPAETGLEERTIEGSDRTWWAFETGCPVNVVNFFRRDSLTNPTSIPGFAEATNDNERATAIGNYVADNALKVRVANIKTAKTRSGFDKKYLTFEVL